MNLKSIFVSVAAASAVLWAQATEPSGYYASCEGKKGSALLSALQNVVGGHTNVGYDGLWDVYKTSDVRDNGKVWDMYSTKQWTVGQNKCGNYKNVGDCYNREHSVPQSWFNDASPMKSDAFHIYPTDGKVNGQRSNYPYGECANGTTLPSNGGVDALGRLGKSTFSGYSGTVFEPDDEYKGDFARSYFYMAAAYNDKIKNWNSDMLAGNSYPAFSSWAVNLLLKWHRQDPVSKKETDRNEAVYKHQKNRNPFIDHPEMAEHIWGDRQSEGWSATGGGDKPAQPAIIQPVDGSSLNLGTTIAGVARSAQLTLRGQDLSENVSISVSGNEFSASPSTVGKSVATAGTTVTVTYLPSTGGRHTGTLTVSSGTASSSVALSGEAISQLPAGPVTSVGEDAFVATWSYVGDEIDGSKYMLCLWENNVPADGYPIYVSARDERHLVEDLSPATTYTYRLESAHLTSEPVEVTTLDPAPEINVLFDGDLRFTAAKGEPSEAAELWIEVVNISSDITLEVPAPFQLSSDKSDWSTSLVIDPEEDRVYLRMFSDRPGQFHGSLSITAGDYMNDDVDFSGIATTSDGFFEDFEADAADMGSYNQKYYQGTGARWNFYNAGMWPQQDSGVESQQCVRMGKESNSSIEMDTDYEGGFGTLSLWARNWSDSEGDATFAIESSTDFGESWESAGEATVTSTAFTKFTFTVNAAGPSRIRVRQTAGKRFLLDQIECTNFTSLVPDFAVDYHSWDAYSLGGRLVIETARTLSFSVFALDGTEVFAATVAPGSRSLSLMPGLYIVSAEDFARRVLVK